MCPRAIYVQRASPVLCLRLQRSAFANNKILLLSRGIWAPCEYGRLPSHVIFDHVIRKKITWWLKNKTIITTKDATSPVAVIPFHTRHLKYNEYSYTTIFFFCFFFGCYPVYPTNQKMDGTETENNLIKRVANDAIIIPRGRGCKLSGIHGVYGT